MKTIKIMMAMVLFASISAMGGKSKTESKENTYFVQAPHNHEQCMSILNEMKAKGEPYLSKFWFGCMSGDHTAYAVLKGTSEEAVRKMLPKEEQEGAKIEKVDRFTIAQLETMHKEKK